MLLYIKYNTISIIIKCIRLNINKSNNKLYPNLYHLLCIWYLKVKCELIRTSLIKTLEMDQTEWDYQRGTYMTNTNTAVDCERRG